MARKPWPIYMVRQSGGNRGERPFHTKHAAVQWAKRHGGFVFKVFSHTDPGELVFPKRGELPWNLAGGHRGVMRENPRKNVERAYAAWQRGVKLKPSDSVSTDGKTLWSYGTWLLHRESDGDVLFNSTHYSRTTTTQQNSLRMFLQQDGIIPRGESDNVPRGSRYPSTSFGASLKNPPKRMRKNPSLVVFGNPSRILSKNVVEIRYQHEEDGKYYRHKFARNQVQIRGDADGKMAVLKRVDGKSLLREY